MFLNAFTLTGWNDFYIFFLKHIHCFDAGVLVVCVIVGEHHKQKSEIIDPYLKTSRSIVSD